MSTGASTSVFGKSVPRLEDPDLLRGKGRYVDDIHLPGMLEAAFVRSPFAHAAINGINTDAARALPGVHAVYILGDLLPHLRTERLLVAMPSPAYRLDAHRPALAVDEVTYVGEPVAVVIADNRYIAEDAAALVEVDYDPLPAASDCRAALDPDAPKVHRAMPNNLAAEFSLAYGDTDKAFAGAARVLRESFWVHRGGSHSIECRGVVAQQDALDGRLTMWSSTQTPHPAMRLLADILGRDEESIRVVAPDVGGGFGPKLVFYQEEVVVPVAAIKLGRPVKWIEDRREHFISTTQERDEYWDMELAVDANARILGIRGTMIHDHGAYTARGINIPQGAVTAAVLPYDVPNCGIGVKVALTNKVPVTPVRGAGQPQGAFVIERLLDRVAQSMNLDRAEVRARNLIPGEAMPYSKPVKTRGGMQVVLDSGNFPKCQREALAMAGWQDFPAKQAAARAEGRYLGIGVANFVEGTGRGPYESVSVRVGTSGRVQVASGAAAMGQSTRTMLAQIVAEQLGGRMDLLNIVTGDTAAIPLGFGGFNSRLAVMAGSSAHRAAIKVREKLIRIAAAMLDQREQDLEIVGDQVRAIAMHERAVSFADIARASAGIPGFALPGGEAPGIVAVEHVQIDEMAYANGTAVAQVEVDPETGGVTVLDFVIAHDCGRVIHPKIVEGQITGGVAHGISNALFEWMGYDEDGNPVTTNLGEYLLITSTEMPRVRMHHEESPSPLNPLGVKGVGEAGVIPTIPAIVSAVEDALSPFGARFSHAPIKPSDIVAAIAAVAK